MAVTKARKSEILSSLVESIKNAKSVWFAQTNGMKVSEFSELRKELRWVNSSYHLAKKTLVKIAVKDALGLDLDLDLLPWQVWVVCSNDDSIAWLSKTNTFITKSHNRKSQIQKISWVASIFEWKISWLEETKEIASMPSKETLLGRLVWSMMSPLSGMARFFDAASKELDTTGKSKVWELKGKDQEVKQESKVEEKTVEETTTQDAKEETKAE